jgi:predicted TIM-barrel enzyme
MSKLTLKDLFEAKGKRHLTQVFVRTPNEAAACEEAGIDMLVAAEPYETVGFKIPNLELDM